MDNNQDADDVPVRQHHEQTQADVISQADSIDRDDLKRVTKSLIDETVSRQEALNAAEDQEARLWFATRVKDLLAEYPGAVTIDLVDWSDEVEDGEPFDVDLQEVYDVDDQIIDDVGGQSGALAIRHHWVLDELRVDPESAGGDTTHPGSRISVAKAIAWLADLIAEHD